MHLIVAPQRRWAELVAKQRGLTPNEWEYVGQGLHHVAQGHDPQSTAILIHEQFVEKPQWHEVVGTDGKPQPVARYPITESIGVLKRLGATIEYVRT